MLNQLIKIIAETGQPTVTDVELYQKYFEPLTVSKNTVLEEQDKVPNYLFFIKAGFGRLFYYDDNGVEQTNYLCAPNGFIASFICLINQTKATENVECITDCELLRISYADTKKLIDESENFKNFSLLMFQNAIAASASRANDLAALSAEQRYRKILNQHPLLVQNIPVQYIASYLGIKPESLSRIRRQIIS